MRTGAMPAGAQGRRFPERIVASDRTGSSAGVAAGEGEDSGEGRGGRCYDPLWTMRSSAVRAAARELLALAERCFPRIRAAVPLRIRDPRTEEELITPRARRELSRRFLEYAAGAAAPASAVDAGEFAAAWERAGGG